jgi:hypothetical protein
MKLTGINQLWVANITYVRLKGEFVTLEALRSCFFENNVNEQRHSSELLGKGTQSASPSPGRNPCREMQRR